MTELAKKKHIRRNGDVPALKDHQRRHKAIKEKRLESDAIERAVYDGMQDLRVKKTR